MRAHCRVLREMHQEWQGIAPERRLALSGGSIALAGSGASILGTDCAAIRRRV